MWRERIATTILPASWVSLNPTLIKGTTRNISQRPPRHSLPVFRLKSVYSTVFWKLLADFSPVLSPCYHCFLSLNLIYQKFHEIGLRYSLLMLKNGSFLFPPELHFLLLGLLNLLRRRRDPRTIFSYLGYLCYDILSITL
jgi:hypothetical protein